MNTFEKRFNEVTVDGKCAVVFWPTNSQFDEQAKEDYVHVHLHNTFKGNMGCWFCVKKNEIPSGDKVVFKVPECMLSRVIGHRGMNSRKISKALYGKNINIQTV